MDTIKTYLDNLFAGMERTTEVMKAKDELLQIMEDKYHELKDDGVSENEAIGIVISDFGNLNELKETLGLHEVPRNDHLVIMNVQDVIKFMNDTTQYFPKVVVGIFICILSIIPLFALFGLQAMKYINVSEDQAGMIGVILFVMIVAIGVYLIISNYSKLTQYEYLDKKEIQLEYQAKEHVLKLKEKYTPRFKSIIPFSVLLYILSILPIFISILFYGDKNDGPLFLSLSTLIFIVAISTYLLLSRFGEHNGIKKLLQEDEYSIENKIREQKYGYINIVFWVLAVAIYFGWSFITNDWEITWIVFPIAGLLYAALMAFLNRK